MNRAIDRELDRLLKSFDNMLKRARSPDEFDTPSSPERNPLSRCRIKQWLEGEPDFAKRIVTPLDKNRRQTRRYQSLMIPSD